MAGKLRGLRDLAGGRTRGSQPRLRAALRPALIAPALGLHRNDGCSFYMSMRRSRTQSDGKLRYPLPDTSSQNWHDDIIPLFCPIHQIDSEKRCSINDIASVHGVVFSV